VPRFSVPNRSRRSDLLLLSLGATVGVVAGALLVDRVGGLDRLLSRARRRAAGAFETPEPEFAEAPYGLHDADGGFDDDADYPLTDDDGWSAWDDDAEPAASAASSAGEAETERAARATAQRPPLPDAATLEARVLEAFHHDPVLAERAIDIGAIAPGVIELTGWVHAPDEVRHALIMARGVPDVQHVVDQLAVRPPTRRRGAD
jgi:hypothetical protein